MRNGLRTWTSEETEYIKANYINTSADDIGKVISRARHSVYNKAKRLGLSGSKWEKFRDYSFFSGEQRGWLAGILDGEGWIGIDKRSKRITIQVNNTDCKMIEVLAFLCGGNCYAGKKAKNEKWKQQYVWVLSRRENVVALLNSILPLLVTKRNAAERALAHVSGCNERT